MTSRRHLIASFIAVLAAPSTSPTMGQDRPTPTAVMIFLDDFHIQFQNTPALRTGLKDATSRVLAAGRAVAVVSDGPSSVSIRQTSDPTPVLLIANRIMGSGLKPSETMDPSPAVTSEMKRREAIADETLQSVLRVEGLGAVLYVTERQMQPIVAVIPVVITRPGGMEAAVTELLRR